MIYLSNAFSLQMLKLQRAAEIVCVQAVSVRDARDALAQSEFVSAVGHQDTANIVSGILGRTVETNRINVELHKGDTLYVAQLTGGRLPEGATSLPSGISLKFVRVTLES